ncbi:Ecm9p Ecym_6131 [Eremothecium cymbalariae DBVPG|uniref:Uncharacterized protein n=1 Tax=Eremothecium cymbalariae (strain CBS 270.75 / DBVPG 7215 / KCTC 17166 / NRRL Y-17582) TaxID=931890 RepID=G8JV44_ERECY|nr:hypothetical protein Ecym_6131 [Eremothecium cymbalariae DBVPG\
MALELTGKLYSLITSENQQDVRLLVYPDQPDYPPITVIPSDYYVEIICFKSTYRQIFEECHQEFTKYLDEGLDSVIDPYLITIGLLFTSFENRSILNLHESLFSNALNSENPCQKLQREIKIIETILSCNINSLNKSSSLWLWYRKLIVLKRERFRDASLRVVEVCTRSAALHSANYYCWNFLRWYYDISLTDLEERKSLRSSISGFAFSHLTDASAWDALAHVYSFSGDYNRSDYERLVRRFNMTTVIDWGSEKGACDLEDELTSLIYKLIDFIDMFEVCEWAPFRCLHILVSLQPIEKLKPGIFSHWIEKVSQPKDIKLLRGNPVLLEGYDDTDILRTTKYKNLALKYRLLDKIFDLNN